MISPGLLRIILAALVVLHHSTPLRLGGWAVFTFFVISGYWISNMWDTKYATTSAPILTFIVSRWLRLFPVMAFCLLLYFLFFGAFQGFRFDWLVRQLPIIGSTWTGTPLPPQWSLDVEMQFYLAFSLFSVFLPKPLLNCLSVGLPWFVLGVFGLGYSAWYLANGGSIETPYLGTWFGLFLLGVGLHKSGWATSNRFATILASGFVASTLAMIIWPVTRAGFWISGRAAVINRQFDPDFVAYWPKLWLLVGVLMFVPYISLNVRHPSPRWDREVGNLAYPVYMFHWIPRNWYYEHVDWSRPLSYNSLLLAINLITAFVGGWLIYIFVDKPFERWRKKWLNTVVHKPTTAS